MISSRSTTNIAIVAAENSPLQHFPEIQFSQIMFSQNYLATEGNASTVYKGTYEGQSVAIKMFDYSANFSREINTIAKFNPPSPYIIRFLGYNLDHACLVSEFMSNSDLIEALPSQVLTPWTVRHKMAFDIASALHYIHNKQLVYGDMKLENILLDSHFQVKLSDFDQTHPESEKRICGTPGYIAPEVYLHSCTTQQSDIYSYGILLFELVSRERLPDQFCEDSVPPRSNDIFQNRQRFMNNSLKKANCPDDIKQLIRDCTELQPEKRPSTELIIQRLAKVPEEKPKVSNVTSLATAETLRPVTNSAVKHTTFLSSRSRPSPITQDEREFYATYLL